MPESVCIGRTAGFTHDVAVGGSEFQQLCKEEVVVLTGENCGDGTIELYKVMNVFVFKPGRRLAQSVTPLSLEPYAVLDETDQPNWCNSRSSMCFYLTYVQSSGGLVPTVS